MTPEALRLTSTDGVELDAHLARPDDEAPAGNHAVIFCHGFPSGEVWAERIGADLPELANRAAGMLQWRALTFRFRGCGESTGDFSLQGWIDDVGAAVEFLHAEDPPDRIWVCGFGTGGAVGLIAAAYDVRVSGAVVAGSPADFDDWAANPNRLLAHAKRVGAIRGADFPPDIDDWKQQLRRIRAVDAAELFTPRPLLVLHGSEDELVPHFDARLLADAHRRAELRIIGGAGHLLRHDPRAVAVLLGWLGRQRAVSTEVGQ